MCGRGGPVAVNHVRMSVVGLWRVASDRQRDPLGTPSYLLAHSIAIKISTFDVIDLSSKKGA